MYKIEKRDEGTDDSSRGGDPKNGSYGNDLPKYCPKNDFPDESDTSEDGTDDFGYEGDISEDGEDCPDYYVDEEDDTSHDVPLATGADLQNNHENEPFQDSHITPKNEQNPMSRHNIRANDTQQKYKKRRLTPAEVEEKMAGMESRHVKHFTGLVNSIMIKQGMKEPTRDLIDSVVERLMRHRSCLKKPDSDRSDQRVVEQIPPKPKMFRSWLVYNGQQQYPKGVPPPTDPMYGMATTPNYELLEKRCQAAEPQIGTEVEGLVTALVCANSVRRQAADKHLRTREHSEVKLIAICGYVVEGVEKTLGKENVEVLQRVLNAIDCLIVNDFVDLGADLVDSLLEALNKCLLTTGLETLASQEDPWEMRKKAAELVFKICRKYNNRHHLISKAEIRLMNKVVAEGQSMAAMYGAIVTYAAFGAQVVDTFMKPAIDVIYRHIGKARQETPKDHAEYLASRRLLDFIITVPTAAVPIE